MAGNKFLIFDHQLPIMSTAIPPPDVLQSTILQTLDQRGTIPDTRQLELTPLTSSPSPSTTITTSVVGPTLEAQNAVKGVLDSLLAKEVSSHSLPLSRLYSEN